MNNEQKKKLASIPPQDEPKVEKQINTNISLVTDEQLEKIHNNIVELGKTVTDYIEANKEVLAGIDKSIVKSIEENAEMLCKTTDAVEALAISNNAKQLEVQEKSIKDITTALAKIDKLGLSKVTITNPTDTKDLAKSKDFLKLEKAIVQVSQRINDLTETLEPKQQPDAFLPMRRVKKIGQRLVFDDDDYRSGGGGGGSSSSGGTTQIVDSSGNAVTVTGNKLDVNATVTSSGGAILDGVDNNIKSTVLDLTSSNPVTTAIVDGNGDQITSFGGGTQYTEGDTDASITGTAVMWEDGSNTLRSVSATKPLPVDLTNTGANSTAIKVDGSAVTQPVSGTVTANLSATDNTVLDNIDTSTAAAATSLGSLDNAVDGNYLNTNMNIAGTDVDGNSGNKSAQTLRVVLATDQPQLTNKLLVTPDANSSVNLAQLAGNTISSGVGTSGTGTLRVVGANNEGKTIVSKGGSASSSGDNTLVSAGTNKLKVFSYTFTTTSTTALTVKITDGASGTVLWQALLQAPTSVNVGATATVTPPSYLFATSSATALVMNLSSANAVHYSLSYYDEA